MRSCFLFLLISASAVLVIPRAEAQIHFQSCTSGTWSNATVLIPATISPAIDGAAMTVGDEIAVFTSGGLCAGVTVWDGANTSITVWGDDGMTTEVEGFTAGEALQYRVWDASAAAEYGDAVGAVEVAYAAGESHYRTDGLYGENAIYALSSLTVTLRPAPPIQQVQLLQGWNLVSSYIAPSDPAMEMVFGPVLDRIVLVKDEAGNVYWPEYGIDEIETWQAQEGYAVYAAAADTLVIAGDVIQPEAQSILLEVGWNLIPYLPRTPLAVDQALASVQEQLVLIKDGAGNTYMPDFEIKNFSEMQPGMGYQVYIQEAATLTYPAAASPASP